METSIIIKTVFAVKEMEGELLKENAAAITNNKIAIGIASIIPIPPVQGPVSACIKE